MANSIAKDLAKANKRNAAQKAADVVFLHDLLLRAKTHAEMSVMLSAKRPYTLSRQQVSADLKKLEVSWRQSAAIAIDLAPGRELAGLEAEERELPKRGRA